jgi:thymidylate synthase (FAD)
MTAQTEILDDPNYIPVLDHGFAGLVDHLGDDFAITRAARVSYGAGTKKVSEDRGLIRYLMRHQHTSPLEMCSFIFHLKMPIFVARQHIRHRMANLNEYSGRYSIMSDEFYIPDLDQIKPQSSDNKQGRAGEVDDVSKHGVQWIMQTNQELAYQAYQTLLGDRQAGEDHYDCYSESDPLLAGDFPGIARELARTVLPVSNYTEMYWKSDLNNLFKYLKLRTDAHAQYEIRVLADAIYTLIQPIVPMACEAFEDYMRQSATLSRMEVALLRKLLEGLAVDEATGSEFGLSKRELADFRQRFA